MRDIMLRSFLTFVLAAIVIGPVARPQANPQDALRPPAGAKVAMIEFADLECPSCAHENPVLKDAAAKYHVPWVRHDFPIQYHRWSTQAAINARWFDEKSKRLGDDYRDAVFANQINIATPDDLRAFTEKFAKGHGIALPFVMDPQGKLAAAVQADYDLGVRLGVHQTPTVWIVTDKHGAVNAQQVNDFNKLYEMLDEAVAETGGVKQARK
jgi:protein-disulfide isomerase